MSFDEQTQKQYELNHKVKETLSNYLYYIIIVIITMIVMFVLPFVGSSVGLEWTVPNTTAGWVVYIISCIATSISNVLIFFSFIQQARTNSMNHPNYVEATNILLNVKEKEQKPRSPKNFLTKEYSKKGVTLAVATIGGFIGLSQMVLKFDIVTFIATSTTVVFSIVFGLIEMKKVELYWCYEYLEYARQFIKTKEEVKDDPNQQ